MGETGASWDSKLKPRETRRQVASPISQFTSAIVLPPPHHAPLIRIRLYSKFQGREKKNQSWTPLHLAAYFGHKEVVDILLIHGADIDVINDAGDTPLHKAAYTGRMELVLLLLQHDASVQVVNGEGLRASQLPGLDFEIKGVLEAAVKVCKRRSV